MGIPKDLPQGDGHRFHPSEQRKHTQSLAEILQNPGITIDRLLVDNRHATERINKWVEKRESAQLPMVHSCADSRELRMFPGDDSIMYPTIAAAGHDHREGSRIPHKGKIIAVHYPCGGAAAKADESQLHESGLKDYVRDKITNANVVQQALNEAREASEHSEEPVLAVVVDQKNADIIPIGYIQKDQPEILADAIDFFDPAQMTSLSDLPRLPMDQVGEFEEYLEKCNVHT